MRVSLGLLTLLASSALFADVVVPLESVKNHVNIRLSADAKSEIVGRLRQGDSAPLVQTSSDWHEVEIAGGATGFVSADWSYVVDEEPLAETSDAPTEEDELEEIDIDFTAMKRVTIVATASDTVQVDDDAVEVLAESAQTVEKVAEQGGIQDVEKAGEQEAEKLAGQDIEPHKPTATVAHDAVMTPTENVSLVGPQGPKGDPGPAGPPGVAAIEGSVDYLMKFSAPTIGTSSQIFDDGINVGINTVEPKQRLDVNGNIQIHDRNSNVAGLMISQADGDTGYVMHNRANTLTIGAGSVDRITIDRDGNVGLSVDQPDHPLQTQSGAYVSAGGVWTNSSSRTRKENIADLTPEEAIVALLQLQPVAFNYKNDQQEKYIGFIAEDVPDLVATEDRQSLSTMDIVAVLTKVVQEQQKQIAELEARLDQR